MLTRAAAADLRRGMTGPTVAARLAPDRCTGVVAHHVFACHRVVLDVSFGTGRARLRLLARDGVLQRACHAACSEGIALTRAAGPAVVLSQLAAVRQAGLAGTDHCARLAVRWEAQAADGTVFPALDADLMLTPAGEQITLLAVGGTFRLQPGRVGAGLDRAIVHRCAVTAIRSFMARIACALVHPAGAASPPGACPPRRPSPEQEPQLPGHRPGPPGCCHPQASTG